MSETQVREAHRSHERAVQRWLERGDTHVLDPAGLDGVIEIDPVAHTALVQGMCTVATLTEATLRHGLVPVVVPQGRNRTVDAVLADLGVGSTSLRTGAFHESVTEMDVVTPDGRLVTCAPGEHLFDTFPESRGAAGHVVRALVDLDPVGDLVGLRHLRFDDRRDWARAVHEVERTGTHAGLRVDAVDGAVLAPGDLRLTLASFDVEVDGYGWHGQTAPSSFAVGTTYLTSVRERLSDLLTVEQYLWRWESDLWRCDPALAVGGHGWVDEGTRAVRRWYAAGRHRMRGPAALDPAADTSAQQVPLDGLDALGQIGAGKEPLRLCPVRLQRERTWPGVGIDERTTYVLAAPCGTRDTGAGEVHRG